MRLDFQGEWFREGMWPLWIALVVVVAAGAILRWVERRSARRPRFGRASRRQGPSPP